MKRFHNQKAKRNSSAILIAISLLVIVFGVVQTTGPQYEAGMAVICVGGLSMLVGMQSLYTE